MNSLMLIEFLFLFFVLNKIQCYETKTDSVQASFIKDNGLENNQKNLLRKAIKKSPPSSYLFNQRPLKSSASNDIVLMAALKSNENNIPFSVRETADDILEQELAHNKKNLKTKKLDDELEEEIEDLEDEIELDKELINEIELDRKIGLNFESEQDRLDDEEVEAEKEAIWLEEHGYHTPVDHRFKDARRLIHAYIGKDKRLHYEPLSYSLKDHSYNNNLNYWLKRCLPIEMHPFIKKCISLSNNDLNEFHHNF